MIDIEIKQPYFLQEARQCLCLDGSQKRIFCISYMYQNKLNDFIGVTPYGNTLILGWKSM